jgi:hypothetical protein
MGAPFGLSRPHRQQQGGPIQRLNLRFSSTHSTTAWAGGLMYNPTMSRTFGTSSGSGESLHVWVRCGCRLKACQMRLMVAWLSPLAFATPRVLQCVAPRGGLSSVRTITCST